MRSRPWLSSLALAAPFVGGVVPLFELASWGYMAGSVLGAIFVVLAHLRREEPRYIGAVAIIAISPGCLLALLLMGMYVTGSSF